MLNPSFRKLFGLQLDNDKMNIPEEILFEPCLIKIRQADDFSNHFQQEDIQPHQNEER